MNNRDCSILGAGSHQRKRFDKYTLQFDTNTFCNLRQIHFTTKETAAYLALGSIRENDSTDIRLTADFRPCHPFTKWRKHRTLDKVRKSDSDFFHWPN